MTTLLKHVQRAGHKEESVDILIAQDKISAIGIIPEKAASQVIDASGCTVSAGFIDIQHDDYNSLSSEYSGHREYALQGVTTVVGGQCGISPAPLLYGPQTSQSGFATKNYNASWNSMSEYMNHLQSQPLGVNMATFVGYNSVRDAVTGYRLRVPQKGERVVIARLIEQAVEQGACGISVDLSNTQKAAVTMSEFETLCRHAAKIGRPVSVQLHSYRHDLGKNVRIVCEVAKDTGVTLIISHLHPTMANELEVRQALVDIEATPGVYFECSPISTVAIPLYTLLPVWAQQDGVVKMATQLDNELTREKIFRDLPNIKDECSIISAPQHPWLVGKTVLELNNHFGTDSKDTLGNLMSMTRLQATLYHPAEYDAMTKHSLASPKSLIVSGYHNKTLQPFRIALAYARHVPNLSMTDILTKMSALPAQLLGLKKRGMFTEGAYADIVATNSEGIAYVFINGQRVVSQESIHTAGAGRPISC